MSDEIDHLDWELDEGWVPINQGWGTVTHFQIVQRMPPVGDKPRREFPIFLVVLLLAIPFWLLAGYGLYCLVSR